MNTADYFVIFFGVLALYFDFGCAVIISYVVNAHRKEYEEYPYEPPLY
jgi:hypothetical protein